MAAPYNAAQVKNPSILSKEYDAVLTPMTIFRYPSRSIIDANTEAPLRTISFTINSPLYQHQHYYGRFLSAQKYIEPLRLWVTSIHAVLCAGLDGGGCSHTLLAGMTVLTPLC
jgi:hypothetical protein